MPARRLVVIVLAIASVALASWLGRSSPTRSRGAPPQRPRSLAMVWPSLTWGDRPRARAADDRAWAHDAGASGDAAVAASVEREAELDRTGGVATEVGARICPRAARVLCIAREQHGCRPLSTEDAPYPEDEPPLTCVERLTMSCEDWARRTYADAPDLLVLDDATVASCLVALVEDATEAVGFVALDPSCGDLAVNPSGTGDRCEASWYRCDGGDCVARRCVPRPREDEPCDQGYCATGLVCVAAMCGRPTPRFAGCDDESVCAQRTDACLFGRCAPFVDDGQECIGDLDCRLGARCHLGLCEPAADECDSDEQCGRGRFCDGEWGARCRRVDAGAQCMSITDCDPGLSCIGGACELIGDHASGHLGEGEACDGYGATSSRCLGGLVCAWIVEDGACTSSLCAEADPFEEVEGCH